MSLYSAEEICEGCTHAHFHKCCGCFCHCKIYSDGHSNGTTGKCDDKKEFDSEESSSRIIGHNDD